MRYGVGIFRGDMTLCFFQTLTVSYDFQAYWLGLLTSLGNFTVGATSQAQVLDPPLASTGPGSISDKCIGEHRP